MWGKSWIYAHKISNLLKKMAQLDLYSYINILLVFNVLFTLLYVIFFISGLNNLSSSIKFRKEVNKKIPNNKNVTI